MKNLLAVSVIFILFLFACTRVPITGRKQMAWVPSSQMQSMAYSQYGTFMRQNKAIKGTKDAQMLQRVGQRITAAVNAYLSEKGMADRVKGFKWEYNLVQSNQVNAWCMPGGKIAFYTGILPYTYNEAGMAAVMGHEVAHAIAKHGNERMTRALKVQAASTAGQILVSAKNPQHVNLFNQAVGAVGGTHMLAFSRTHELEADRMGMIFMAKAGYHPKESIEVWKRMAKKAGQRPPEFLSTHPHESTRIQHLSKYMKEAMVYYRPKS